VHAEPEYIAAPPEPPRVEPAQPEPVAAASEEHGTEAEKTARRRSTVREKVSFLSSPAADNAPPASAMEPSPAPAPAVEETAPATAEQPRKAGWWSRRFGGGE
jgi:ribonuclease E